MRALQSPTPKQKYIRQIIKNKIYNQGKAPATRPLPLSPHPPLFLLSKSRPRRNPRAVSGESFPRGHRPLPSLGVAFFRRPAPRSHGLTARCSFAFPPPDSGSGLAGAPPSRTVVSIGRRFCRDLPVLTREMYGGGR